LNCVVGKHATFRLQPISRTKDVVIDDRVVPFAPSVPLQTILFWVTATFESFI